MLRRAATAVLLTLAFATQSTICLAFDLSPGRLYSSKGFANSITGARAPAITEYDSAGNYVDTLAVPPTYGSEVRGLTFGLDGAFYAVVLERDYYHYSVVQIDGNGVARVIYRAPCNHVSAYYNGQIAAGSHGDLFVALGDSLFAFNAQSGTVKTIFKVYPQVGGVGTANLMSVVTLPSGNLLVADGYRIWEMTTAGVIVRRVAPNQSFEGIFGLAYDADTNRIFVSQYGYTNYQVMSLDGTNDVVLNHIAYSNAGTIALTSSKSLLVGGYQSAGVLDENLNLIGVLQGNVPQLFLAEMPPGRN